MWGKKRVTRHRKIVCSNKAYLNKPPWMGLIWPLCQIHRFMVINKVTPLILEGRRI